MMFARLFNKSVSKDSKVPNSFEFVKVLILELLSEDENNISITPETSLENLGFDSIKFINLMLSMEDYIQKDIEQIAEQIDLNALKTVNDIVILVDNLKNN